MSNTDTKVFLAADLGATSGRLMAGVWDGETISLEKISRFPTPSTSIGSYSYWDILSLYTSIEDGIASAVRIYGDRIESVSVDTWGVDYGLLDSKGELLSNPICYRDGRTARYFKELPEQLGKELIYAETGIQFMCFNTVYQLNAEIGQHRSAFENAERLLFLPDLLNYWLSGLEVTERSVASTSQLLNPKTGDWSTPIMKALGLDPVFLGRIVESGTLLGPLKSELAKRVGAMELKVVTGPGHDTACAFMAMGSNEPGYAILSSGTWSLMGLELKEPNCSVEALEAGFSNEIGYGKSVRFLKNICGLWLMVECRRQWVREGVDMDYEEIVKLAEESEPMRSLFDPDDARFATPGDMTSRISEYCIETGQPVPSGHGEVARSIYDSLAMKYRFVFEQLKGFAEEPLTGLHVLGGGSRNALLNQMTADALGVSVMAGPAEATAIGNVMCQMITAREIASLEDGRDLIRKSFEVERFEPKEAKLYDNAYERFEALVAGKTSMEI